MTMNVWRGCDENKMVFSRIMLAPPVMADKIPASVSRQHQAISL